nr:MAG TPA: hypothetical protein [Caudoviricetes sp.]
MASSRGSVIAAARGSPFVITCSSRVAANASYSAGSMSATRWAR